MKRIISKSPIVLIALASLVLYGCDHDDNAPAATATYQITMTNLSNNQPLSPAAFIIHLATYSGWAAGSSVNVGLETLAESGDNSQFITNANASASVVGTATGAGVIAPGASDTVSISVPNIAGLQLTATGMLVNTNDAFAGITNLSLPATGSRTVTIPVYDAGTEANTELAATIPGPAGGGTGFDAIRDDRNFVSIHPGVVTASDGLATSALDESHRFDNPVARVQVIRIN